MNGVLVVSSSRKAIQFLCDFIKASGFYKVDVMTSGNQVRRSLLENQFDVVVINAPLSDEYGDELAIMIADNTLSGVILIVKYDISDDISEKVEDFGVFVVSKPIIRQSFYQAIKLVSTYNKKLSAFKNENYKLHKRIEDMRIVNRAKCMLIQHIGMTEANAHRYIEKKAMDTRVTKRQIALDILREYEGKK